MTPQVIVELVIGVCTVFFSAIGTAVVIGMFLGDLKGDMKVVKTEMRMTSDRLAKIEGVFTLVPRMPEEKKT